MEDKASVRKEKFYSQLTLSSTTISNYKAALNSSYLRELLRDKYEVLDIFEIVDLKILWNIYSFVNLEPKNIANHRAYSAPIMKYIRFLNNGKKYGRRIDSNKPRPNMRKKRFLKTFST